MNPYQFLADTVVLIHLAFTIFVVFGGLLIFFKPWIIWPHIPAVLWGAVIEFAGWICPLTPLENRLRIKGGGDGYAGGYIEHYIIPILYPAGLTREIQVILGIMVVIINMIVYGIFFVKLIRRKKIDQ